MPLPVAGIKPGELTAMLKQKPKYLHDSPSSSSDSEDVDTDIGQQERMLVNIRKEYFNQLESKDSRKFWRL